MTRIGEEVIFSSECLTRFYRLPIAYDEVNFIVNTGRNSVSAIQARDQKLLQTWTVTHPHSFTTPVVYNSTDSTLSCVLDGNVIVTWLSLAEDLSTAGKVKLKHPVFALLPIENGSVIVVFANGAVCLIEESSNLGKPADIVKEDEELVYTGAVLHSNDVVVANLMKHKKTCQFRLTSSILKNGTQKFQQVLSQDIICGESSLISWCLVSGSHHPSILLLWRNGEIHKLSLLEENSVLLFSLTGISTETAVAMDVLNREYLAVAKTLSTSGKKESLLEIWDLNFSVMKGNKLLKHCLTKNIQVTAFDSCIFLTSKEGIVMLPITAEASTLSSALGRARIAADVGCAKVFSWTSEGKLQFEDKCDDQQSVLFNLEKLTSKKSEEVLENLSKKELSHLCKELSRRKDITEEEIVKILKVFLRMEHEHIDEGGGDKESSKILSSRNKLLNAVFKIPFSDIFLIRHLKRLDFEETVVALEFLSGLLESQLFSGKEEKQPSDLQVVNWIELLTQSHYDELVTSKDVSIMALLKKLQISLRDKMEVYTELDEIECLLSVLRKKCSLSQRSKSEKYCIETPFS